MRIHIGPDIFVEASRVAGQSSRIFNNSPEPPPMLFKLMNDCLHKIFLGLTQKYLGLTLQYHGVTLEAERNSATGELMFWVVANEDKPPLLQLISPLFKCELPVFLHKFAGAGFVLIFVLLVTLL